MLSAAGYGVRIGMDLGEVVARIEEAALAAPRGKRSLSYVREKLAELRHHAIPKFRQRDQDKDQKAAAQEAEGAPKDAEPPAEPPVEEAIWRTKDEAAPFVDQAIQTWVDRAGVHIDELPPKLIALATPAGFGKTRRVLSKWARLQAGSNASLRRTLADLLKGSPVNLGKLSVAVPTHNLGIEFQDRVIPEISEEIGSLLEMPRLLGRRPETCQRYDVVRAAIEKGHAPKHVCRQVQPNGTEQVCPFFGKCSSTPGQYQYELARVRDARNSIITHKHLAITGMPELRLDKRKSQWIDEDPTGAFLQREQAKVKHIQALVTDHDFAELERHLALDGAKSAGTSRKGLKRLEAIRDVFLQQHATQAEPQLEDFAAWSSQELRTAASDRETIERWRRGKLNPTIPDAELTEQLAKAPAPKKLAGLLNRLADEMDARSAGPIYSYEWRGDKLVMRGRLPTTKLPPNILLTDATASPTILRAVFPGREIDFQQINIHRNAHITQVRDLRRLRIFGQRDKLKANRSKGA
jgi:hypothetical protein